MAYGSATVFVWNNSLLPGIGGHFLLGHVSMLIGKPTSGEYMPEELYVSWGPHLDESSSNGHWNGQAWTAEGDFGKYAPDHVILVDNLDQYAMRDVWRELRRKPNAHYRRFAKNCSTVVTKILKVGRGDADTSWLSHFQNFTPLQVKRLALSMSGHQVSWQIYALHYGFSPKYVNLLKRSSEHGHPATPARFVGGRDTIR